MPKLSHKQFEALSQIKNGADILSPSLARTLRAIEKRHPRLVEICSPMGRYGVREKLPYFGAIATTEGRAAIAEWRKKNQRHCAAAFQPS